MADTTQAPVFYVVPAGTKSSRCNGATCTALMYWITNPDTGRMIPIHCDVPGGTRPSEAKDHGQFDAFSESEAPVFAGKGISHFTDCVNANDFHRRGAR